ARGDAREVPVEGPEQAVASQRKVRPAGVGLGRAFVDARDLAAGAAMADGGVTNVGDGGHTLLRPKERKRRGRTGPPPPRSVRLTPRRRGRKLAVRRATARGPP